MKNKSKYYGYIDKLWEDLMKYPNLRFGQTAFNTLCSYAPELAESIRGSDIDPFHTSSERVVHKFFEAVEGGLE